MCTKKSCECEEDTDHIRKCVPGKCCEFKEDQWHWSQTLFPPPPHTHPECRLFYKDIVASLALWIPPRVWSVVVTVVLLLSLFPSDLGSLSPTSTFTWSTKWSIDCCLLLSVFLRFLSHTVPRLHSHTVLRFLSHTDIQMLNNEWETSQSPELRVRWRMSTYVYRNVEIVVMTPELEKHRQVPTTNRRYSLNLMKLYF